MEQLNENKNMCYCGTAVSKGVAIGKVMIYKPFTPLILKNKIAKEDVGKEISLFKKAQADAIKELDKIIEDFDQLHDDKAEIFIAHKMMVLDPDMEEEIIFKINELESVSNSIHTVIKEYIKVLQANSSEVMREREFDLKDVERRLLRCLEGIKETNLANLNEPIIIVSHDLGPSDTATLNKKMVKGIITEVGGQTSHSAIIARAYEIPAVLGVKEICSILSEGETVVIDALKGEIHTNVSEIDRVNYLTQEKKYLEYAKMVKTHLDKEPITLDKKRISINLNVASTKPEDLEYSKYVDGCGLFRTEFIFMGRSSLPTEDEQFEIYKKVLMTFKDRVTIRTLDIGGDKKLECMDLPTEENPFLGERALRFCLSHKNIFKTQLRAILKASVFGKVNIMFPMVGTLDDLRESKKFLDEIKKELDLENIPYSKDIKVGIMIEIPSIALVSDIVAKEVDFASIGTNDLCQYSLAVDRLNPNVSKYYQMYNPGVLRLISYVVKEFNKQNKVISVCGEMGGNPLTAAVLIGFGMEKLSMSSSNIAAVKKMVISNNALDLEKISKEVITLSTNDEIKDYLDKNIK